MHVIKKNICYGLEKLFSVAKIELRLISSELILPFGADISKDDLIENTSNVMINEEESAIDLMLALIEKEEEDEGLI